MKKLVYIIIVFVLVACNKEELDQPVLYENLYTIQDDPSDPVKHRIYEIYEKYGLPVYFNDTIGKYYVKDDVQGNPYYRYELVDLNWNFYSDNSQGVSYKYYYQTDPVQQLISLDFVEKLLENISKPLQPYILFVADSISFKEKDKTGYMNHHVIRFRSVAVTRLLSTSQVQKDSLLNAIKKGLIQAKISRYKPTINEFGAVCKAAWYGCKWKDDLGVIAQWWWWSLLSEGGIEAAMKDFKITREEAETACTQLRTMIGAYGFVRGAKFGASMYSPEDVSWDLDCYMSEMLSCDRKEFIRRWGEFPLVMKKYEILYNLLRDELDCEL